MDKKGISFGIGKRLKNLREEKGISCEKLAATLSDKYGIRISGDSLRDYEIDNEYGAKAAKLPNMGMRLEYLYVLADFYGVSLDYIVGLSPAATRDRGVECSAEYLGLTAEAVEALMVANKMGQDHPPMDLNLHVFPINGLSVLFKSQHFLDAILLLEKAISAHFISQRHRDCLLKPGGDYSRKIELANEAENMGLAVVDMPDAEEYYVSASGNKFILAAKDLIASTEK